MTHNPTIDWPRSATARWTRQVLMIHEQPGTRLMPDDSQIRNVLTAYGEILGIQHLTFGSGLQAVYVTFDHASAVDSVFLLNRKGCANELTALKWRIQSVSHLWPNYIPPREVLPDDLPDDVLRRYNELSARKSETSEPSSRTSSVLPPLPASASSLPPRPSTSYGTPKDAASVSGADAMSEAELRGEISHLRRKLDLLRTEPSSSSSPSTSTAAAPTSLLSEANSYFEHERSKRRDVSDRLGPLKEDLEDKARRYKNTRNKRRELESTLADAEAEAPPRPRDVAPSGGSYSPSRPIAGAARNTESELVRKRLDELRTSVDEARRRLEKRKAERDPIEVEIEELKAVVARRAAKLRAIHPRIAVLPDLLEAFKALMAVDPEMQPKLNKIVAMEDVMK